MCFRAFSDFLTMGLERLLLSVESDFGVEDVLAMSFGLKFEGNTVGNNLLDNFILHPLTQRGGNCLI